MSGEERSDDAREDDMDADDDGDGDAQDDEGVMPVRPNRPGSPYADRNGWGS